MLRLLACTLTALTLAFLPVDRFTVSHSGRLWAEAEEKPAARMGPGTEHGAVTIGSIAPLGGVHPAVVALFQALASLTALAAFSAPGKPTSV